MIIRVVAWVLASLLTVVIAPYALLVVGPFIRHGLFFRSEELYGGFFDPEGLSPYDWFSPDFRYTLMEFALFLHQIVAGILPVVAVALLILLFARPAAFSRRETLAFYFIALLSLLLFCAAWSLLQMAPTWLLD
jgi:hypothetical protein